MLTAIACVPPLIWAYLLLARGGFWRVSKQLTPTNLTASVSGSVVAVIPARNEAAGIGHTITSLLQQDFPCLLRIIVVDDQSEDGTAEVARRAAARVGKEHLVTLIPGRPLPSGWTGKMWAVAQGVAEAERLNTEYLLLTDADIQHAPNNISELLRIAQSGGYDLVSYMVKLACEMTAEKALIPAFVFFFLMLYPPAAIRSTTSKVAGAAGGCMLIRTTALRAAGGIDRIRSEVIDDCALASAVKSSGGRVWLGLTASTRSLRSYSSFGEIERVIARTAFNQLQHSWLLLGFTCLGLLLTYLLPVAFVFSGHLVPAILGATTWALMAIAYLPMVRFYRRSAFWSTTLPLVALFYMAATVHSAVQYASGKGGQWKGRTQDKKLSRS